MARLGFQSDQDLKLPMRTLTCFISITTLTDCSGGRHRQRFCRKPECRKARNTLAHRAWLSRNPDHYKGSTNVERVQEWRKEHPEYLRKRRVRKKRRNAQTPLQHTQQAANPHDSLQELLRALPKLLERNPLILGIVARISGSALPKLIAQTVQDLIKTGEEIQIEASNAKD